MFLLKLQQGSRAFSQFAAETRDSSLVVAGNLGLAGELPLCLRPPFEVQQEISVQHGMQDSTGVLSRKLGLYLSLVSTQCSW